MDLRELFGISLPIIQAPMAGVQCSALAVAVSNAGALRSLPCATLTAEAMCKELATIATQTNKPYNVNFFCYAQPEVNAEQEMQWRKALSPYYAELGVDPSSGSLSNRLGLSIVSTHRAGLV